MNNTLSITPLKKILFLVPIMIVYCIAVMAYAESTSINPSPQEKLPQLLKKSVPPAIPITVTDVLDFGYIEPASRHVGKFKINNPSEDSWIITDARVQCNCTKIIDYPQIIYPEESAMVTVQFYAPDIHSNYSKKLYMTTSYQDNSTITLKVKARIGLPLSIDPPQLDLESLIQDEKHIAIITIHNDGPIPVQLVYATSNIPGCIARIPRTLIEPNGTLQIPITYTDSYRPTDQKSGSIKIHTLNEHQRILILPIINTSQVDNKPPM